MAVDAFMKIDGIEGESTDAAHKGEIEVDSFSWGLSQSGVASATGGAGSGKVQFQDFHFMSPTSKASPKIFLGCATGQHYKEATLSCRKAGGDANSARATFMVVKMNDVLSSSYQNSGSGEQPTESVSLNFTKIEFSYRPQNSDGALGEAVTAGWDIKANKKI
jgi:type VI secretion system secreted protein Hcp